MSKVEKEFYPSNQNIYELFTSEYSYDVPNYQRQYAWTSEQLDALWDSLYNSFSNNPTKHYFLGSIVVVDDTKKHYSIVDGQQRLTTIMIMLNVLTKTFPELKKRIKDFDKLVYVNDKNASNKKERLQLQTDPSYNQDFSKIVIKAESYEELEYPTDQELKRKEPKYKFTNTCKFFYDKFIELFEKDNKEFFEFIDYILYNVELIKIVCFDEGFAIKLFLVMNDTGLDLSPADIIKVYLIDSYDKTDDNYEKDKIQFDIDWKKIEANCNAYDVQIDDLLVYYEYYKLKQNPKSQLIDELKKIIAVEDVDDIVSELIDLSKSLSKIYDNADNVIYSLRYLPWHSYVNTCILTAYLADYSEKDELFKAMRRFFYLSLISGKTLNGIKQTTFNLIGAIADNNPIDEIKKMLEDFIREKDIIRNVYLRLESDVYGENFLKPLMLSVDYDIRESVNTAFYECNDNIHMDHILPKKYYKNPNDWPHITDQEATMPYLNKLGNMQMLLGKKNEEALNFSMERKIQIMLGEDQHKTGRVTFDTTQAVIDTYNQDKIWDVEHIIARQEYLMGLIENMLEFSSDDIVDVSTINSSAKWQYNGQYYNNKSVIQKTIVDYIVSSKIMKYDDIPEELRNLKMHSHLLFKNALTEDDIEHDYSYNQIEVNNFNLYIRDFGDKDDTVKYVETLKKYYDCDIESIESLTSRNSITKEMVEKSYELGKKVYEGQISENNAVDILIGLGMNSSSAVMYVYCVEKMLVGEVYKRATSIYASEYFISKIREDYGKEYSIMAENALEKHIEYLKSYGNNTTGLEQVLKKQREIDN